MTQSTSGPRLPSAQLHTTQVGETGPRIVFCHGLFGQGKNWTSIAKALAGQCRSTLVDLPNHGRSSWTEEVSYESMAGQIAELLSDQDEGEPVTVVGHSMGGKVAMALALLRPALVRRLCVVDIAPVSYGGLSGFARYVEGMRSLDLATLPDRTTADLELQPYVPDPTVRSFLLQNLRRDGSGWRWQMNLNQLGDHLGDLGDWPLTRTNPYLGPTLWLAGAQSSYVTSEFAAPMRALFPRVQLVTVKQAGHWVHSEQPQVFVQALQRFMAR